MKKTLCLVLLFTIFASTCYAQTADNAAQDLAKYEIMSGFPDGTFRLEDNVTRAQTVKMIMTTLGKTDFKGPGGLFSDVSKQHWAKDYIEGAIIEGVIDGFPDGTFRPEDNVTKYQTIKMVICMLGYDKPQLDFRKLEYPKDYLDMAIDCGLITTEEIGNQDAISSRGFLAQLISKALDMPITVVAFGGSRPEYVLMNGLYGRPLKTLRMTLEQENY